MRRAVIAAFVASALVMAALTSCGGSDGSTAPPAAPQSAEGSSTSPKPSSSPDLDADGLTRFSIAAGPQDIMERLADTGLRLDCRTEPGDFLEVVCTSDTYQLYVWVADSVIDARLSARQLCAEDGPLQIYREGQNWDAWLRDIPSPDDVETIADALGSDVYRCPKPSDLEIGDINVVKALGSATARPVWKDGKAACRRFIAQGENEIEGWMADLYLLLGAAAGLTVEDEARVRAAYVDMVVAGAQASECVPRFGAIEGGDHLLAATGFLLMAVASSRPGGLSAAERQLFANAPRNFLFLVGAVYGAENCYVRTFQRWLKDPPDRPSDLLSCAA